MLIHNIIPVSLIDNLLNSRDTGKIFELKGDLLKMITNKYYNVDLANLSDKNLMHDFAKEMHFDLKSLGNKSTRDRTFGIELLTLTGVTDVGDNLRPMRNHFLNHKKCSGQL